MRCDCHVHLVGPRETYPQTPARTYTAGEASLAQLEARARPHGVERFIIVQPSFYGADNTMLLDALAALEGRGRGVAVIDPDTASDNVLQDYAACGVCGLRLNLYSPLGRTATLGAMFARAAAMAQTLGGHVEVIAPLPTLAENAELLARSPAPVVIDHYGLYGEATPDAPVARDLLALLALPHVWIKLSAPYRCGTDALTTRPDTAWLDAIIAVAAERCVWGSDWPHTPAHDVHRGADASAPYRPLDYGRVLADFVAALPSRDMADLILTKNPARLYGFADAS